jgi:leucyl-tRNA synthetase
MIKPYIKSETAEEIICSICDRMYPGMGCETADCEYADCEWMKMLAEESVDAVPVVRCKDCKYYKISELHPPYKFCFRLRHPTENRSVGYNFADDDFCSHGECREDKDG